MHKDAKRKICVRKKMIGFGAIVLYRLHHSIRCKNDMLDAQLMFLHPLFVSSFLINFMSVELEFVPFLLLLQSICAI